MAELGGCRLGGQGAFGQLLLQPAPVRVGAGARRAAADGGSAWGQGVQSVSCLQRKQEIDRTEVSVMRDVGPAADDGDAFETGQWDREADTNVGAHPQQALARQQSGNVYVFGAELVLWDATGHVWGHVDVLQVFECFRVVKADGRWVFQGDPQTYSGVGHQADAANVLMLNTEAFLQTENKHVLIYCALDF